MSVGCVAPHTQEKGCAKQGGSCHTPTFAPLPTAPPAASGADSMYSHRAQVVMPCRRGSATEPRLKRPGWELHAGQRLRVRTPWCRPSHTHTPSLCPTVCAAPPCRRTTTLTLTAAAARWTPRPPTPPGSRSCHPPGPALAHGTAPTPARGRPPPSRPAPHQSTCRSSAKTWWAPTSWTSSSTRGLDGARRRRPSQRPPLRRRRVVGCRHLPARPPAPPRRSWAWCSSRTWTALYSYPPSCGGGR